MALIPCPECQREVSSVALACPQCAFPHPGRNDRGNGHYGEALRTCPDCRGLISRQINSCPHCGAPAAAENSQESLPVEEGEETWMCPNCGVPFTRKLKAKKLVEGSESVDSAEAVNGPSPIQKGQGDDEDHVDDVRSMDQALPSGIRKKKNPLWEDRGEGYHAWKRKPRKKNRWKSLVLVLVLLLLSASGWAIWEFQGMSGLEALVYWNR